MGDKTDKQAERIASFCGWIAIAVVILLAIAVCIGIVVFAVWLNT
jgi:low affinity Fe/Cu permease